jgi:hypothetical protein
MLDGRPGTVVASEVDDGMPVVDIDLDDGTKRWILWTPGNARRVELIEEKAHDAPLR